MENQIPAIEMENNMTEPEASQIIETFKANSAISRAKREQQLMELSTDAIIVIHQYTMGKKRWEMPARGVSGGMMIRAILEKEYPPPK